MRRGRRRGPASRRARGSPCGALLPLLLLPPLAGGRTFRFIALGDFGTGGYAAGQVAEVSCAQHFHEMAQEYDAQFTISVGDNMYIDPNTGMRHSFEETWCPKGTHGGGLWFPIRGNHDNHQPQIDYTQAHKSKWWWPSMYYTREIDTGLGFSVQVWSVDTADGSPQQMDWLKRTLRESKARWKLINTHYPYTNAGRHSRVPMPVTVAAIAKEYGAQIYFNGHDHIIQTSVHQGVVFVTTGAVARGAMMDRNIQRADSKFVFTLGVSTSVGAHGFMLVTLTKNVAWGAVFGFGGMVDEFATVWDWPRKYGEFGTNALPPRDLLRSYLREEAQEGRKEQPAAPRAPPAPRPPPAPAAPDTPLPPASKPVPPSGGAGARCKLEDLGGALPQGASPDCSAAAGTEGSVAVGAECVVRSKSGGCGKAVCGAEGWVAPTACADQLGESPQLPADAGGTASQATYLVSADCRDCSGPTMGSGLTVWIQGIDFGNPGNARYRVFLSFDDDVCSFGDVNSAIAGAMVKDMKTPLVHFTPQGALLAPTPAYVCLSDDGGRSYHVLRDKHSAIPAFTLYPKAPSAPAASGGGARPLSALAARVKEGNISVAAAAGLAMLGLAVGLLLSRPRAATAPTSGPAPPPRGGGAPTVVSVGRDSTAPDT
eukprot:TRINITY_DN51108_c0_g1_i1.p1 TRINITY_DN51108_c0_g1~~TRINITY_DN51108_c0_g1_i1.p1  ORF type:complete len:654 (+),score=142.49 TRINITY_DN51108_c0_g1_i1:63-2024(+)